MRMLGNFIRYVLNINTIWGLMIVASFVLCVVQHYLPTTTTILASYLGPGENNVVIRIMGRDEKDRTFDYRLALASTGLAISPDDQVPRNDKPWLISARQVGEAFLLKWDCTEHGTYTVSVRRFQDAATAIPASRFVQGENILTLRSADRDGRDRSFEYEVTMSSGQLLIASGDTEQPSGVPRLVSAEKTENSFLFKWDRESDGRYALAVDQVVTKGTLVTLQSLTDAAFDYAQIGFNIALGLVAAMVLFLGIMKVGEHAGIVQLVAKLFYPVIRFLFPEVPKEHPANGAILMNVTTTVLGLGNAATPFGLKAMKELQKLNPNPEVATDAQVMLLGYNTAGLALLPTTLLALRKSAGCGDPFEIIGTCMLAGAVATVVAIVMVKLLAKVPFFTLKAAVAEHAREEQTVSAAAGTSAGTEEE